MRHKYDTRGIVLSRAPSGEASARVVVLTPGLGLVHARAQGLRHEGAKLAPALVTFAESDLMLVRGREGWRVAGAILAENWFARMRISSSRERAARVSGLLLRLVAGEAQDTELFGIMSGFFEALAELPEEMHESAEILAALSLLSSLGLDAGELPDSDHPFTEAALFSAEAHRDAYIARINSGIAASGL